MNYNGRLKKLQARLRRKKLDAILISRPENRTYLCGYVGGDHSIDESSGVLIVPARGKIRLLTDFRFKLQARREAPKTEVLIYTRGLIDLLLKLLPELGITTLAFESHYTLHCFTEQLRDKLAKKKISIVATTGLVEKMRVIKDDHEINRIRESVRLNEKVFRSVYDSLGSYPTEIDLALAIENTMKKYGAQKPSFDTIVASGANGALPHAVPGLSPVKKNQPLTIDMGLILNSYCSDMTRNLVPRKPSKKYCKLHRIVRRAQLAGIAAIKAGVKCSTVDRAARRIIEDAGYGKYFGHSLGHGVGLAVHEEPRLSSRNNKKLRAGMIVTVEPGIYIPDWGGIRLEDMVVITENGCENLNQDTTWLDI
jgi:Xaa-Pro aminopeptidase